MNFEQNTSDANSMAIELGILHNQFKLFSKNQFQLETENDITRSLVDFPYLDSFYNIYKNQFNNLIINNPNSNEAKSIDLPFIGEKVIDNHKADFIFYFEGSLSKTDKLSITVLAHLWLTKDESILSKFLGKDKWWTKSNFDNIVNKLNINKSISENTYVADAIRFEDKSINKKLIEAEIKLLKPELVVSIGNKAKEMVGMKYYDLPTKFHYVKFPKYHNEQFQYEELSKILENFKLT